MQKTTVYLPEELDLRLEAEAAAEGVSKAELIRRGVTRLLDETARRPRSKPLPVFDSGRPRSAEELGRDVGEQIAERTARR